MSTVLEKKVIPIMDKTPGKRCSDYDADCDMVPDPYTCYLGTSPFWSEGLGVADGYCPLLIGMDGCGR